MSTDLVKSGTNGAGLTRETSVSTRVSLNGWAEVVCFADAMAHCPPGMVPKSYSGSAPAIAAAVMTGAELGVGPMEALRSIYMVDGKPQLASELMLRLAMKAGVRIEWIETSDKAMKARFTRAGYPDHVEAYTWGDAERAGVTSKDPWKRHPRNMLRARLVSNALRAWAPDVLGASVYSEGEIEESEPAERRPVQVIEAKVETTKALPAASAAPTAKELLAKCATPVDLEAWCDAYAEPTVRSGDRAIAAVVAKGASMVTPATPHGVPELVVRQWLGLAAPTTPERAPDPSSGEVPADQEPQ